ncbi:hypothetical protein O6H91_21G022300 [Diphasiastrum complanatum]|uniref:Uncharacterized protein n=1 Tax=Diphasiastrum complanatum TaxID=34168 RepID=A0ACC2AIS8_DIPCM|nr:hypothetical protein O6H91_21G022300 [Diphasiastrum complanatum]
MDSDDQPLLRHRHRHHLTLSLPLLHCSSTANATPSPSASPSPLHLPKPPPPAEVIVALAAATGSQAAEAAAATGGGGHGREDCWSEGATFTLINAWGAHYLHLNRGNLKQKDWREVSAVVNARGGGGVVTKVPKTDVQCKNRLDTLKKKYKLEKRKMEGDLCTSKWPFYAKLDKLIGPSKKGKQQQQPHTVPSSVLKPSDQQAMDAADRPSCSDPIAFVNRNPNDSRNPKEHTNPKECTNRKEGRNPLEWTIPKECTNARDGRNPKEYRNLKDSTNPKESPATTDSSQNSFEDAIDSKSGKKLRLEEGDDPLKHLAQAIIKFGEVYERIESAKQQQLMEIEKQRMKFLKDLELQKMQLFMQTQVELAKMKHSKHGSTGIHCCQPTS